jgi:hypothetical protein
MNLLKAIVLGPWSDVEQLEIQSMEKNPFEQSLAGMTTEQLVELKGDHLGTFAENPKSTHLGHRIQQIEAVIRSRPDAPKLVKVRAKAWVRVDGKEFRRGGFGEITESQFNALSRFFEVLTESQFDALQAEAERKREAAS